MGAARRRPRLLLRALAVLCAAALALLPLLGALAPRSRAALAPRAAEVPSQAEGACARPVAALGGGETKVACLLYTSPSPRDS